MQKRLFVAVSLPEDIKKRLFRLVEKEYGNFPVKWGRKENFHLTLNFVGYVPEENIPGICDSIRQAAGKVKIFELEFEKTEIGPSAEISKMIWATGKICKDLPELKFELDKALGFHVREKKEFRPHITLGRIKRDQWKKISPAPKIERDFFFSVPVSSIELCESKFEKGKRVYYVLESFPLR